MSERASPPYRLPQGKETLRWGELYGSGPAYFLAESAAVADAPLVVVAGSGREAEQYLAELRFFAGSGLDLRSFPDRETLPYDPFSPHPDTDSERLRRSRRCPG
jgi:transcription-repair coupling factor (superfamily II helicase)